MGGRVEIEAERGREGGVRRAEAAEGGGLRVLGFLGRGRRAVGVVVGGMRREEGR